MNGRQQENFQNNDRFLNEVKATEHKRDYTDPEKHYVRKNVWEPVACSRLEKINQRVNRRLRYFTLCAEDAIDIHYFYIKNLISSENGTYYPDTVYCECDKEPYEILAANFGKTIGFLSKFEDLVLKTDSVESKSFYGLLPFDIFNLDFTSFCFPSSDPPFSDTINAIFNLIETMANLPTKQGFDMLFTFRAERKTNENETAINQLLNNQKDNITNYQFYKQAVEQKGLDFNDLVNSRYYEFLLYSLPKIIGKRASDSGLLVGCPYSVYYPRPDLTHPSYYIISFVMSFDIFPTQQRRSIQPELCTTDSNSILTARYFELLSHIVNSNNQNIASTRFSKDEYKNEVKDLLAAIKHQ